MSKPPSAPPDAQLIALFRAEIAPAAAQIASWLRSSECTTEQAPTQVMNAVLAIKSASRVLGIAALAEFVDAIERCVDAFAGLLPSAHRDALQVMTHALTYLDQLARAPELPQFIAGTLPELAAMVQALDDARASSDSDQPELDDEVPDPSLLELFRTEVEQCAKSLSDGVLMLDAHGPLLAPWESLMRAAHSLKGAARIVKLPQVAQLAHALEECFLVAQNSNAPLPNGAVDALLQAIDALQNAGKVMADRIPGGRAHVEAAAGAIRPRLVELAERKFGTAPLTSRAPEPLMTAPELRKDAKASAAAQPRLTLVQAAIPAESVLDQFVNRDTIIAPFAGTQAPEAAAPSAGAPAKPPAPIEPAPAAVITPSAPASNTKPTFAPRTTPLAPKPSQGPKQERVLRVAAESINRLMGLAGESVVESRRGAVFGRTLAHMKKQHAVLIDLIDAFERTPGAAAAQHLVRQAKEHARACATAIGEHGTQLDDYLRRASDLGERVYREALRSRMRPFADGTHGFPRLVRDLSQQLGKRARLEIEGESTEVDRDALDSLEAPINHLLRNALDHGVEPPAERSAAGKSQIALLRIEARHHAGMLSIAISDDGRGIDVESIRKKAIERGHASAALAAGLTRAELIEFLFLPGFSTAAAVSEISGRGVGLDVVKNSVEALGGSVRVHSERGRGTTFHLHLPVTRSVVRAVVAEVDGEAYAFPLLRIDRIDRVPIARVKTLENREYVLIDEQPVALISARSLFELEGASGNEELQVIVVSDRSRRYGVVVDALRGEHDLFVRPLDVRLGKVQDIAAAAILLDGAPALIVDVDDLMRSIERRIQSGGVRRSVSEPTKAAPAPRKRVLVVDDSIMVREAERQLLESRGYSVDVAVDGVDGWNSIRRARYDLVITDVDMPRMNGIELVRSIKRDAKLSATPVVIVSYKDRDEDRMRGLEAGANYYLSKGSFDDDKLVEAVQDLIGGAAA